MMKQFDPSIYDDDFYQNEVDTGKYDSFKRSDNGGVYKYYESGDKTIIKDVEPADNMKKHQQTDFTIENGEIVKISSHNDY